MLVCTCMCVVFVLHVRFHDNTKIVVIVVMDKYRL